jgi:putative membrane protein insertion efficiency factor
MAKINLLQKSLNCIIAIYRYTLSPMLGYRCRFYPSCSEYAQTAITQHGAIRGLVMSGKRLLSCHPFHAGGYDPVPEKRNKH